MSDEHLAKRFFVAPPQAAKKENPSFLQVRNWLAGGGEALFCGRFLFFRNELPTWPDFTPGFRNELGTLQNPISIAPYNTVA